MQHLVRFYSTSYFWSRISPEWDNISKIRNIICNQERFLSRSAKEVRWNWVHCTESRTCEFGPTQIDPNTLRAENENESRKRLDLDTPFQRTGQWGIKMITWSMTSRDPEWSISWPNTILSQYFENSLRCYLATIANHYIVCCACEAVRSAILATSWLLVIASAHILYWTLILLRSVFTSSTGTRWPSGTVPDLRSDLRSWGRGFDSRPWLLCTNANSACHPYEVG